MGLLRGGRRRRSEEPVHPPAPRYGSDAAADAAADASAEEAMLLARLRWGDEDAFSALVDRYHAAMVRVARAYVPSDAVAEEVAQEAWVGVLRGLNRFEGRSSLRTWIFRILVNQAKTHGARERRVSASESLSEPSVDPERFENGGWVRPPTPWSQAEDRLLAAETGEVVRTAIATLPPLQQQVINLRDVVGLGSDEVCSLLELSDGNQRVLLHRARSRVRTTLEHYMEEEA